MLLVADIDERCRPCHLDARDACGQHWVILKLFRADKSSALRHVECDTRLQKERPREVLAGIHGHRAADGRGRIDGFLQRGGIQGGAVA